MDDRNRGQQGSGNMEDPNRKGGDMGQNQGQRKPAQGENTGENQGQNQGENTGTGERKSA